MLRLLGVLSSLSLTLMTAIPVMASNIDFAAVDLASRYFAAVEQEDLSAVESMYHFRDAEHRVRILHQFEFAFDMADTRVESLQVERAVLDDVEQAGVIFVAVRAVLTSPDGTDAQEKVKRLVMIVVQEQGEWKIAKVMRKGDYDASVRLVAYQQTPEAAEQPIPIDPKPTQSMVTAGQSTQQAVVESTASAPKKKPSVRVNEARPQKTAPQKSVATDAGSAQQHQQLASRGDLVTVSRVEQRQDALLVELTGRGLQPGTVLQGELEKAQVASIVQRGMVSVSEQGQALLQFRAPFMGWSPGGYTVNIVSKGTVLTKHPVELN